jgi:hypothetical protein
MIVTAERILASIGPEPCAFEEPPARKPVPAPKPAPAPPAPTAGARVLRPCGTPAAHARHITHGEEPCDVCRAGKTAYDRERKRAARASKPPPEPPADPRFYFAWWLLSPDHDRTTARDAAAEELAETLIVAGLKPLSRVAWTWFPGVLTAHVMVTPYEDKGDAA